MFVRPSIRIIAMFALAMGLATTSVADTVYLKNGATIDGTVTGRHEGNVILNIGNVGTVKIPQEEIDRIEKNSRTGYLDPSKRESAKPKELPKIVEESTDPKDASKKEPGAGDAATEKTATAEPVELDPELEKRIATLAEDLTQQRTQKRVRAERQLESIGDVAIPSLLPLAKHPFVRTRTAVFRLFKRSSDFRVVEPALAALEDDDRFVRKLAWETLKQVSGKSWEFPWDGTETQRKRAIRQWSKWVEKERAAREKEAAEAEAKAKKSA